MNKYVLKNEAETKQYLQQQWSKFDITLSPVMIIIQHSRRLYRMAVSIAFHIGEAFELCCLGLGHVDLAA